MEAKARVEAGIVSNSSLTWGLLSCYLSSSSFYIFTTGSRRFEGKHGRIAAIEPRSHPLGLVSGSHKSDYLNASLHPSQETILTFIPLSLFFLFMALRIMLTCALATSLPRGRMG